MFVPWRVPELIRKYNWIFQDVDAVGNYEKAPFLASVPCQAPLSVGELSILLPNAVKIRIVLKRQYLYTNVIRGGGDDV